MHSTLINALLFVEAIALFVLLPIRHALLVSAGIRKQGKITKLVNNANFDIDRSLRLVWFIYRVYTPILIVLIAAPISTILFLTSHYPLAIVLPLMVVVMLINYLYVDRHEEVSSKLDCAYYRAQHGYTNQLHLINNTPEAVSNRSHIH